MRIASLSSDCGMPVLGSKGAPAERGPERLVAERALERRGRVANARMGS